MTGEELEIQSAGSWQRAATIVAFAGAAVVFHFLALRDATPFHPWTYLFVLAFVWATLYWIFLPRIKVVLRQDGVEFVDFRWGVLFQFPRYRAGWRDLVDIDTHTIRTRNSWYVRTRVTARVSESPEETRYFSVRNRDHGYYDFLATLKSRVEGTGVRIRGLGIDPADVRQAAQGVTGQRLAYIALALVAVVVVLVLRSFFAGR